MWNTNISDGYGNAGYGGGYGGGWGGVGLFGLLGLRGIDDRHHDGDRKDCNCCEKMIDMHDHHDDSNHTVDEIHKVQMEVCAAERQMGDYAMMLQKCCCDTDRDILEAKYALSGDIKDCCCELDRDILNTKFDLSTQILNNRFESTIQFKDLTHDVDLQACGINRNIDSVKFNQEILAKDAAMQLADCCCKLENRIRDSIDATNNCCCETQKLMLQIDSKNDLKDAERERRALQREIDELRFDKKFRDNRDEQNVLNNFGIINDSLNKVITALGNTSAV